MDAKEFLMICTKECRGKTCNMCKFYEGRCALRLSSSGESGESDKELEQRVDRAVSIAEKLSHVKTYADDFFEKFPDAPTESNGQPIPCRDTIYRRKPKLCGGESCLSCWNEPFPKKEDK